MGYRYLQRLVCEFHDNDEIRLKHYNDMKYTSLTLFNAIIDDLRKGFFSASWVDIVLAASKVIEETTLMRLQMKMDEATYKHELVQWHLEDNGKMLYRIPTKVDTFERFRNKKSCKVKDHAIEIVAKMYRIHQMDVTMDVST